MSEHFVYRALFPPHYNPRFKGKENANDQRSWYALRLPYIRVMGPLWSFGLRVSNFKDVATLPGMNPSSTATIARSLRTLYQQATAGKHGQLDKFHKPIFLRADVDAFLQPTSADLS
ncbi:MAG: hypothetical protein ACREQZ_11635, partial [Woeseiaceae bacterium]